MAEGNPGAIKAQQKGHLLELIVAQPQRAVDLLKNAAEPWRVSLFGDRLHMITDDDFDLEKRLAMDKLSAAGIHVLDVREGRFSLEDVFISVVQQSRSHGVVPGEA